MLIDAAEISIHSPRMGRDMELADAWADVAISIHSPRMGRDITEATRQAMAEGFQSTLPAWGETERDGKIGS